MNEYVRVYWIVQVSISSRLPSLPLSIPPTLPPSLPTSSSSSILFLKATPRAFTVAGATPFFLPFLPPSFPLCLPPRRRRR